MKKTISETPVEWDERKSLANIQKHGISFETAALVFADDDRIEYYDKQHSEYNGIIRTLFRYYPDRGTELSGRLTGIIRIKFRNYSDGIMILSGFRSGIIRTN